MGKKILNQTNVVLVALYTFSQMTQVIFYKTCHLKKLFKNPPPFPPNSKRTWLYLTVSPHPTTWLETAVMHTLDFEGDTDFLYVGKQDVA